MDALTSSIAQLRNQSTAPVELVAIIDSLEGTCGFRGRTSAVIAEVIPVLADPVGHQNFISAGGISALFDTAVTGWPADGNLAASKHPYDTPKEVKKVAVEHEHEPIEALTGSKRLGGKWRSPRRRAIVCLTNMARSETYMKAMEAAGLFAPDTLAYMLESSFAHIDYSLHNKGWEYLNVKDQTQTVAVELLNLATCALRFSGNFLQQCQEHTAMFVAKLYRDPMTVAVDRSWDERQALRAQCQRKGWSSDRIEAAVMELKDKQRAACWGSVNIGPYAFELGGVDCSISLFYTHLIIRMYQQKCPVDQIEHEILQWVHCGGLLTKLKGNVDVIDADNTTALKPGNPIQIINFFNQLWSRKAVSISRELYKIVEGEEAQAAELRQKANDVYKAGQLQEALDLYWQAVNKNPQDYALFNSISLVALKLGHAKEALRAAEESIRLNPTLAKSWARLGDALRHIKRWQLANLAYTLAGELAAADTEVKARQEEMRRHLSQVWKVEDIPARSDYAYPHDYDAAAGRWMRFTDPADIELLATPDALWSRFNGYSRFWALTQMKAEIQEARAIAVGLGLVPASSLPQSCAGLKRIDQLLQTEEEWQLIWDDTPMKHNTTGQIRFSLYVQSTTTLRNRAFLFTLGKPGVHSIRRVLLTAMLCPMSHSDRPMRPKSLDVRHRMFPMMHKIREMCEPWGIYAAVESQAEAKLMAKCADSDWEGYNNDGKYEFEKESTYDGLFAGGEDPDNGHKGAEGGGARGCVIS